MEVPCTSSIPGVETLNTCLFLSCIFSYHQAGTNFTSKKSSLEGIPYENKGNTPDANGERRWKEPGLLTV